MLTGPTRRGTVGHHLGGVPMLRPCDPDVTIELLRFALSRKPEDVELGLVFDLVAQLVTDLRGWMPDDF
jgi:hypothetical protein